MDSEAFNAADRNDLEKVKMYIEKGGVSPTITGTGGLTLAHVSVKKGYLDMLKYLLEKDPSLLKMNLLDEDIEKPCNLLGVAVKHGSLEIVKYLVENHEAADIYEEFQKKYNSINWAIIHGRLNIIKYFIEERRVDVNKPPTKNLCGDIRPLLFDAVESNHSDIITYLIEEKKADLTVLDGNNENILYEAVRGLDLNFIKYILDEKKAKIDINWKNKLGETLVYLTIIKLDFDKSRIPLLRYLIGEKHADLHMCAGEENWTPLLQEVSGISPSDEIIKYLVECGADVRKQDKNGNTALHLRIPTNWGNMCEICKYLCAHGANVNQKNNKGETPLDIAVQKNCEDDDDDDDDDDDGRRKNYRKNERIEVCKILIDHGANLDCTNKNGESLVHIAAIENYTDFLDYLVREKHVEINAPRKTDNWTPLHCAVSQNNTEICKYLIEHGADTGAKSKSGKIPAQLTSDQNLIDYIGNSTTTKKSRRSLDNSLPFLQNSTNYKYTHQQRIAGPVDRSTKTFSGDYPRFGLQNFFVYVNLLVRFFIRNPVDLPQAQQETFLPIAAILRNRIDPNAENAVGRFTNNFTHF